MEVGVKGAGLEAPAVFPVWGPLHRAFPLAWLWERFLAGVRSCACRRRSSFPSAFRWVRTWRCSPSLTSFRAPRCALPQAWSRRADGPAPRPGPRRSGQPHGHSARLGRGRSAGAWKRAPSQCASTIVLTPRHMVPSKNSEKKPHSRCCKGRKLARDSQACKMPAPLSLRGEPASGELAGAGSVHARTVPRP